jgi:ribosomal-protein-serine acetyltransferase
MVKDMKKIFTGNNTVIETSRLFLTVPSQEDAVEINAAINEVWDELQLWMSWAYDGMNTLESTRAYINSVQEQVKQGGLPLIGRHKDSGRFVVSTGLHVKENGLETGYWVAKDFLGQGYATEACVAAITYGFNSLGTPRILINHYDGNEKSRKIIEKLGFTKTGYLPASHKRCSDGVMIGEHQFEMADISQLKERRGRHDLSP